MSHRHRSGIEEIDVQPGGQCSLLIVDLVDFGLEVVGIRVVDRLLSEASPGPDVGRVADQHDACPRGFRPDGANHGFPQRYLSADRGAEPVGAAWDEVREAGRLRERIRPPKTYNLSPKMVVVAPTSGCGSRPVVR